MKNVLLQWAIKLNNERKRRKSWQKLVQALSVVVVFCTTYALILPAITMEKDTICGLDAHTHSEACYTEQISTVLQCGDFGEAAVVHKHGGLCYDENGALRCDMTEQEAHTHDDACYTAGEAVLVCTEPEAVGHAHGESCYEVAAVPCALAGTEGHACDAGCIVSETKLICTEAEAAGHAHGEDCYTVGEAMLSCEKEEIVLHSHEDACYLIGEDPTAAPELICTMPEAVAHDHEEACLTEKTEQVLTCTAQEHEHTDTCYPEVLYASDSATVYICDMDEHTHGEACVDENGTEICTVPTHTHDDSCVADEESDGSEQTQIDVYICGKEAHTHDEGCSEAVEVPCALAGTEGHACDAACVVSETKLICEAEEHTHDDACKAAEEEPDAPAAPTYICGKEEHTHDAACSDEAGNVICTAEEHTHDNTCVEADVQQPAVIDLPLLCTAEEHTHGDDCYAEGSTEPACGKEVHAHALKECYEAAKVDYTYEDDYVSMTVHVVNWAQLPKNLDMTVTALEADNETYTSYEDYAVENSEGELLGLSGYVIGFNDGITAVELPEAEITVDLTIKPVQYETPAVMSLRGAETMSVDMAPALEETTGITVTVLQNGDEGVAEQGRVTYENETDSTAPMSFTLGSGRTLALASARAVMPEFKVEFYAHMPVFVTSSTEPSGKHLDVIDTSNGGTNSGGKLPANGTRTVSGVTAPQNAGVIYIHLDQMTTGAAYDVKYELKKEEKEVEVYTAETMTYYPDMKLEELNKIRENDHYQLDHIRLSYDGGTTWTNYNNLSELSFTNNPAAAGGNVLLVDSNTTIRLGFLTVDGNYSNSANFFDYDISNGKFYRNEEGTGTAYNTLAAALGNNSSRAVWMNTNKKGINANASYVRSSGEKLAFGNSNTGMGYETETLGGYYINQFNRSPASFKGCSFGLVTGYDIANDRLIYASGLNHQALFNDEAYYGKTMSGKTTYGGNLQFKRNGDTYILSSVSGSNGISASNLHQFNHPGDATKYYNTILTNNFWPMDGTISNSTQGHDFMFGDRTTYSSTLRNFIGASSSTGRLPPSDDFKLHNSYFGLQYAVKFELDGDYCGPLEYLFYGDDDMWVFLTYPDGTSKLICDIGGVHSSVGSYTDLWDWIQKGEGGKGNYTLTFFYTERGASGSSCYMAFTIPQVTSVTQNTPEYGSVSVKKEAVGESDPNATYRFRFDVGSSDMFAYNISGVGAQVSGEIDNGDEFTLKAGQTFTVQNIKKGTSYKFTELNTDTYDITWSNGTKGNEISGTIQGSQTLTFTCTNTALGNLSIGKTISGSYDGDEVFTFDVTLQDRDGNPVSGTYGGVTFTDGKGTVQVQVDQSVTLADIPVGYKWTVLEQLPNDKYTVAYKVDGVASEAPAGTIAHKTTVAVAAVNTVWYTLPNTGGPGTFLFTIGGMMLIASAGVYTSILWHKRRKGGG